MKRGRLILVVVVICFAQAASAVEEVRIGYFGPSEPSDPIAGDMFVAASLAVQQANAAEEGVVYKLMSSWAEDPWGSGVKGITELTFKHNICAIIGGIDGVTTHLAEQVAAKARLPLINPVSTDISVNLAGVPWVYSCVPGDDLQAKALIKALESLPMSARIVLLSANDHDSHVFAVELVKALNRARRGPAFHYQFDHDQNDIDELIGRTVGNKPDVLLIAAGTDNCIRLVEALQNYPCNAIIVGPACMASNAFRKGLKNVPGKMLFPLLYWASVDNTDIAAQYLDQTGNDLDYRSAYTYDAVSILIDAIREARATGGCLRDSLAEMKQWKGVTGKIEWDTKGRNQSPVRPGTYRNGKVVLCRDVDELLDR